MRCRDSQLTSYVLFFWALVFALLVVYFETGCSSLGVQNPLQDNSYYINDMNLSINGVACNGACKAPKTDQATYVLKISTPDTVDQIVVSTCVRTDIPIPDQLGSSRKGYTYLYTPGFLEHDPGCNLAISGYMKDKGIITSAVIVFDNARYQLDAGISCNAQADYGTTGTAICQAMQGQRMMVWFQQKVKLSDRKIIKGLESPGETADDRRCQIKKPIDGMNWKIDIPDKECNYVFETIDEPYKRFLLFTIGAEKIPIRSDE